MLPESKAEIAVLCRKILEGGSFEDQERDLAYLAVNEKYGFNELRPARLPSMPKTLITYRSFSEQEKDKFRLLNPGYFRDGGEGGEYYRKLRDANVVTERNLEWLKRMKAIFEAEKDQPLVEKVQNRIYEFDEMAVMEESVPNWQD